MRSHQNIIRAWKQSHVSASFSPIWTLMTPGYFWLDRFVYPATGHFFDFHSGERHDHDRIASVPQSDGTEPLEQ
jgi:hypothetical protein